MPMSRAGVVSVTRRLLRRGNRGQMAVMFLVFIGLIIAMAAMTMNLGEVAKLKTTTANAADGGALAGASWIASGENEAGLIAQGMWINWLVVMLIFLLPFCDWACLMGVLIAVQYALVQTALQSAANDILEMAHENAQTAAMLTAIQNSTIDDPTGAVKSQIAAATASKPIPTNLTFNWERESADGVKRPSSLTISATLGGVPELSTSAWAPILLCTVTCLNYCCWAMPAWGGDSGNSSAGGGGLGGGGGGGGSIGGSLFGGGGGGFWSNLAGVFSLALMMPSACELCFIVPIPLAIASAFGYDLGPPDGIDNGDGEVTVTVTHHREGGGELKFWTMKYPAQITSQGVAHYNEADTGLGFGDDPGSEANLVSVL